MSRPRIQQRLRRNDDFKAVTRYLDGAGVPWRAVLETRTGHPELVLTMPGGAELRHKIACTPRSGGNAKGAVGHLRRVLTAAGFPAPPERSVSATRSKHH